MGDARTQRHKAILLTGLGLVVSSTLCAQSLEERLSLSQDSTFLSYEQEAQLNYPLFQELSPFEQLEALDVLANAYTTLDEDALSIHEALLTKKRNCFTEVLLMKLLGDDLGIDIDLVKMSNHKTRDFHIIARYNLGNGVHLNYDAISATCIDDAEFFSRQGSSEVDVLSDEHILALDYHNQALLLVCEDNNEDALSLYDMSIALDSSDAIFYFNKANSLKRLGQLTQAKHMYSEAIKQDSSFAEAYNNRGIVNKYLKCEDEALNDYTKAIMLDSGFAEAYYNRGLLLSTSDLMYNEQDALDYAKRDFETAVDLDPVLREPVERSLDHYILIEK